MQFQSLPLSKLRKMAILGAHMSIAGGFGRAVQRASACGSMCVQLFTKNNTQWKARPILPEEVKQFREALVRHAIRFPIGHASYLINLASPDRLLRRKSIEAFIEEMHRAEMLGLGHLVVHPGAYTESTEGLGLWRIVQSLGSVAAETRGLSVRCLLETTAGQGTSLGWRFEQLARVLDRLKDPDRLGVCFDTCHVFAAGYNLTDASGYRATMRQFDATVGLRKIEVFHLNDSRRECGSRIDRHAHIGHGRMGLDGFRALLGDRRFRKVPMYLETPKGMKGGVDWDVRNLATLHGLIDGGPSGASRS